MRAVESAAVRRTASRLPRARAASGADLRPAIYDLAREQGWPLRELRRDVRTLETVFNELATAPAPDEAEWTSQEVRSMKQAWVIATQRTERLLWLAHGPDLSGASFWP